MKLVKSLLLSSAAGLIAVGGAQAADLPVKAKAVEYVKVCSLYGAGFYYIPGTDTCIKLGGYLRADVLANTNNVAGGAYNGVAGGNNRLSNGFMWRSRADMTLDTRTATEYGVVRTYSELVYTWTSDSVVGNGSGQFGGAAAYNNTSNILQNASSGTVASGQLGVYMAFIQFAGFTMGRGVSVFSAPWTAYPGNNMDALVGGSNTVTGTNLVSYTADFGGGVSAAISVQDPTQNFQSGVFNLGPAASATAGPALFGANNIPGTMAPDIVGMVRVDQAWGLFQASAALHDVRAGYYGIDETTGHPQDKWGWAGALALSIKNIPTGPGDTINVQGVYTNGATRYNIQELSQANAMAMYGSSGANGAYQSVGFGMAPDAVFGPGGSLQLVSTWGFRGAYTHNWDPYWSTSVYGAYASVSYTGVAKGLLCGVDGTISRHMTAGSTCNPDYNVGQLGVITRWTPVKNLTFSADLMYTMLDQKMSGFIDQTVQANIAKPNATYALKDQNTVTLLLRAQRNW